MVSNILPGSSLRCMHDYFTVGTFELKLGFVPNFYVFITWFLSRKFSILGTKRVFSGFCFGAKVMENVSFFRSVR